MTTDPASSTAEFPSSTGFVGRRQELGALRSALAEALSGQGRVVMLTGEPGIGKTRTAQELAAYAETQGAQVLWGRCYEGEGAPPYWPWVQPLKSYLERTSPDELQADLGPGAGDLGELLPDLREKLPGLESPPALEPEQARFRLFNSVTTFLKNVSQRNPLVLVLDDLHWADRSSLLLLQFLSQQLGDSPLLVLGTYRDVEVNPQHPLSDTLAQLSREPVFRRQSLQGLSLEDAGAFMELTAGIRPTPQLINTVYARTEGNPFFTAEVVRLLSERGALQEASGVEGVASAIPVGVLEVIGRRLNRLSSQCHQTLTTAAVMGREFDFLLLEMLRGGTSEEQLLDVIDEALAAHLIEELPRGRERYQFCHALIQQTLTQQLSSSRKVRLHARIAEALEELYGANAEAHATELAYHYWEAQTLLGAEKLVKYSLIAGEQGLASYAWEDALQHFQRGLDAKGIPLQGAEPAQDRDEAALVFGLARAQQGALERHQMPEAIDNMRRAFDYYLSVQDVKQATAIASVHLSAGERLTSHVTEFTARLLPLLPEGSLASARLLVQHSLNLGLEKCDYEAAEEVLRQALQIAQRERDALLEMEAYSNAGVVAAYQAKWESALDNCLRAIDLAQRNGDPVIERGCQLYAGRCLMVFGEIEQAARRAEAALSLYEKTRGVYGLASALLDMVEISNLKGDWNAARAFSNRGLQLSPKDSRLIHHRAVTEYQTGVYDQGKVYLERLLEAGSLLRPGPNHDYAGMAAALSWIIRITGDPHYLQVAKDSANSVISSSNASPRWVQLARTGLGILAVEGDETALATEQYEILKPMAGLMPQSGFICFDRLLGLLAHTVVDLSQAAEHFEDALAFCRKAGYRPEMAWTCHDYAETLLKRSQSGDLKKAASLLEEALSISTELGMRPLRERVLNLQERVRAQPARPTAYPDGLTQREVEVLRLIASGKSNREIAKELVISLGTVANHVTSILNKAGLNNRTEAAGYAFRQGLAK